MTTPVKEYTLYENKKKELRKFLETLDKQCKSRYGLNDKYIYPKSNPYTAYHDVKDFKKRVLKDKTTNDYISTKTCKFITNADDKVDKDARYYVKVQNKRECDFVNGEWDGTTPNRRNTFDDGTCWLTEQDKICGAQLKEVDPLRSYRGKFNTNMPEIIVDEANRCNATPGCNWKQQSLYTYDCTKTKVEKKLATPAEYPPEHMSLHDFEIFLEEWYIKKKWGVPPETGELLGKGDRCNRIIIDDETSEAMIAPPMPIVPPEYISFRNLDPTSPTDASILKQYMKESYFKLFKDMWKLRNKMGEERYAKYILSNMQGVDVLEEFYTRIDKLYFETDGPVKHEKLHSKDVKLLPSIPQSVVNMVMKNDAMKKGTKRGMLAWHSTGSGKTCTATGVMDSYWDTDKQIIFASSIDAIASNPDFKFHECAMNLFPRFQKEPFKGSDAAHSMALIGAAFKKRGIRFLSFAKLSNRVMNAIAYKKQHKLTKRAGGAARAEKKPKTHDEILAGDDYVVLDNCVLIIDECDSLFKPLPNQKKQHEALEKELIDPTRHPGLKLVILTATPGDNIPDVMKLLNMIRDADKPLITPPDITKKTDIERFKKQIRGLVSYFDMSADDTKFPRLIDTEPIKYPMSDVQYAKYLEAYKSVQAIQKNYNALAKNNELHKYWEPVRKYANMLFNFEKDMDISNFSSKLPNVINTIEKYPNDKQYLYSAFYARMGYGGHGVVAIGKELEKRGYEKLTISQAKKLNKAGKLPPKGKRYILVISTELGEEAGNSGANLHELLKIYNHPDNKNGELIHIMLASNNFYAALDLKDVTHIHLFEPLVAMATEKQAFGRARRFCSHKNKNRAKGEWVVNIHRYMADKPVLKVIDNGPMRKKLTEEISELETKIANDGSKEAFKMTQKAIMNKKKEIAKMQKQVSKGTASEAELEQLEQEFVELQKSLRDTEENMVKAKDGIQGLKSKLNEKKKELKKLDAPPKTNMLEAVDNIEEMIQEEAKERFKQLFIVYNCMREMAVDCRLLKEFHSATSGQNIECV
jgi:hypothetical protein